MSDTNVQHDTIFDLTQIIYCPILATMLAGMDEIHCTSRQNAMVTPLETNRFKHGVFQVFWLVYLFWTNSYTNNKAVVLNISSTLIL